MISTDPVILSECSKTRILIVEDHPIFRMGMRDLINQETDIEVCGEAENIQQARKAITLQKPRLVIVDISLKDSNGLELVKEIEKHQKDLLVLVLSMHDELLYAERSLRAGAEGYIMKQDAAENVVQAIRTILNGGVYVSERYMGRILKRFSGKLQVENEMRLSQLSDREIEVFHYIGKGYPTREIAEKMNISPKTVGTHRERIKEKLKLKHSGELVRFAVNWLETERDKSKTDSSDAPEV